MTPSELLRPATPLEYKNDPIEQKDEKSFSSRFKSTESTSNGNTGSSEYMEGESFPLIGLTFLA